MCKQVHQNGDFIGRISNVRSYAIIQDSFIFVNSIDQSNQPIYYVLNVTKDSLYADIKQAVTGPIDNATFVKDWLLKYNIRFITTDKK